MFSFIIGVFILLLLLKIMFHIGFGLVKILFGLVGVALLMVFLPIGIFLLIPLAFLACIIFIFKIVF